MTEQRKTREELKAELACPTCGSQDLDVKNGIVTCLGWRGDETQDPNESTSVTTCRACSAVFECHIHPLGQGVWYIADGVVVKGPATCGPHHFFSRDDWRGPTGDTCLNCSLLQVVFGQANSAGPWYCASLNRGLGPDATTEPSPDWCPLPLVVQRIA